MLSLFPRRKPRIGSKENWFEFDAALEDSVSASVKYTSFPIEIGANASDHGIIQPKTYTLKGGMSDNPLGARLTDFAGGFLSNLTSNSRIVSAEAFSAGYLSGSDKERGNAALEFIYLIMYYRIPFDIDSGQLTLTNMVFTDISTKRDPKTEGGMMFTATFQELPLLRTILSQADPSVEQLNDGDQSKTMASSKVAKGIKSSGILAAAASSVMTRIFI